MNLHALDNGAFTAEGDPGEPGTQLPRISVTPAEGEFLGFVAEGKRVLEIGTGLGISTRYLAKYADVTTVDIDPWVQTRVFPALDEIAECLTDRDQVTGTFDVVFIDGRHTVSDTKSDIAYAETKCPKGLIVVHDAKLAEVRESLEGPWAILDTDHGIALRWMA